MTRRFDRVSNLSSTERRRITLAFGEFIDQIRASHFITFNFGYLVRPQDALPRMKFFCTKLERAALGRNWAKCRGEGRLIVIGFPERIDLNPHWHCVAYVPDATAVALEEKGIDIWADIERRGQLDVSEIRELPKVSRYIRKRLHLGDALENVFVYGQDGRISKNR
jgi:hypothetical protein